MVNIIDLPTQGGGFFSAKPEMKEYAAFFVEVKDYEEQRPGQFGPKDSALVDLTVFATEADLTVGIPSEVREGVRIEYTVLTRDLKPVKGGATIVVLDQSVPTKPGQKPAWVWRQPSADVKRKVIAYVEARDAELEAALADAPSFDD